MATASVTCGLSPQNTVPTSLGDTFGVSENPPVSLGPKGAPNMLTRTQLMALFLGHAVPQFPGYQKVPKSASRVLTGSVYISQH